MGRTGLTLVIDDFASVYLLQNKGELAKLDATNVAKGVIFVS